MTITIPDEVIDAAKRVARSDSAEAVVIAALREFAARHDQRKLTRYLGTFRDDFLKDQEPSDSSSDE